MRPTPTSSAECLHDRAMPAKGSQPGKPGRPTEPKSSPSFIQTAPCPLCTKSNASQTSRMLRTCRFGRPEPACQRAARPTKLPRPTACKHMQHSTRHGCQVGKHRSWNLSNTHTPCPYAEAQRIPQRSGWRARSRKPRQSPKGPLSRCQRTARALDVMLAIVEPQTPAKPQENPESVPEDGARLGRHVGHCGAAAEQARKHQLLGHQQGPHAVGPENPGPRHNRSQLVTRSAGMQRPINQVCKFIAARGQVMAQQGMKCGALALLNFSQLRGTSPPPACRAQHPLPWKGSMDVEVRWRVCISQHAGRGLPDQALGGDILQLVPLSDASVVDDKLRCRKSVAERDTHVLVGSAVGITCLCMRTCAALLNGDVRCLLCKRP